MTLSRYREIEATGTPRELGRQIGEAAREEIRGFVRTALKSLNQTMRIPREKALAVARQCIPFAAEYSPDMMGELHGMAEASGASLEELMLLQVRNQFRNEDAGCTSFAIAEPKWPEAGGVVAQNWDNDPALDAFTVVLTRRPVGKPAFMTVTQAGLIAYIGFSEAGLGLCLNTLPAAARDFGTPHYFTIRGIYEASSRDDAAAAVRRARRAIPANIMLITPEGPADFEITLDDVHVLDVANNGRLTHTNHCLHPRLLTVNADFPELIQSYPRKRRIDALLGAEGPLTLDDLKAALRDHENHPRSICRHTNEDPETGFWRTIFSVIIEPGARRMHVTRGTPCEQSYETYHLN